MKQKLLIAYMVFFILMTLFYSVAFPQQKQSGYNKEIIISGTRFTYPLIQTWIDEFRKVHPELSIRIVTPDLAFTSTIKIIAYQLPDSLLKKEDVYVKVGEYVLLPVINSKSPSVERYSTHGITKKEFEDIFFSNKSRSELKVYTRQQNSCAPIAFANHFGHQQSQIEGIKIPGDDKILLDAVLNDSLGVTYNNLGFIYNLSTRKVNSGLTIIPIDLNANGNIDKEERFYETLDAVIEREERKSDLISENIFFKVVDPSDENAKIFISWILNEGQKYNHQMGFLKLKKEIIKNQLSLIR